MCDTCEIYDDEDCVYACSPPARPGNRSWNDVELTAVYEGTPEFYITKDSGVREEYDSGMVRDTQSSKPRWDLIDLAFLRRWAELMGRGAEKYGERNWELANSAAELARFKQSALRHIFQYLEGDESEDHAAAVAFNLAAAEYVKRKLNEA